MTYILPGLIALFLTVLLLLFPDTATHGALTGLTLFGTRIVPALLPCMILTQFCIHSGLLGSLTRHTKQPGRCSGLSGNGLYIAILGLLCGIPMGAKLTADFYRTGKIRKREALYLLFFTSQLSPAFLLQVAWQSISKDAAIQHLLFLSYYMSLFLLMFSGRLFLFFRSRKSADFPDNSFSGTFTAAGLQQKEVSQTFCLSENLDTSIMNSVETLLGIGGYVILFSVLADFLLSLKLLPEDISRLVSGMLEITAGIQAFASGAWSESCRLILASGLCAFGGLSSLMQIGSVLKGSGLPVSLCRLAKLLQAGLTMVCTAVLYTVAYRYM